MKKRKGFFPFCISDFRKQGLPLLLLTESSKSPASIANIRFPLRKVSKNVDKFTDKFGKCSCEKCQIMVD